MDEQELRNFLGGDYPSDLTYQRILKERVESFPGALEIYQLDPNGIIYNRDSWFLVTQLMPSLVTDYGESPDSHLIDFVKPHHPNFVWMTLLSSGSAVSASTR